MRPKCGKSSAFSDIVDASAMTFAEARSIAVRRYWSSSHCNSTGGRYAAVVGWPIGGTPLVRRSSAMARMMKSLCFTTIIASA